MTALLLLLGWLLAGPVVAALVSMLCRGGHLVDDSWYDEDAALPGTWTTTADT